MLMTEDFDSNEEWQRAMNLERMMKPCPDCRCGYGQQHRDECDVERCSSCGQQRATCDCTGHDPEESVWLGVWPAGKEVGP
jgi:hypothetical protein